MLFCMMDVILSPPTLSKISFMFERTVRYIVPTNEDMRSVSFVAAIEGINFQSQ